MFEIIHAVATVLAVLSAKRTERDRRRAASR
jgi:hypothetical protein